MSDTPHAIVPPPGLPDALPLFVLPSILLLPRGRLPLNIFEPRYRAMIDDALGNNRMVGVVQQLEPADKRAGSKQEGQDGQTANSPLYKVGCAGKIMTFSETEKGNYLLSLQGICRFALGEELPPHGGGYRRAKPDWSAYGGDLAEAPHGMVDRIRLYAALRNYFRVHGITANWDVIKETADEHLIISLAMTCPFAPWEHQAILEASNLTERAQLLLSLIEMATLDQGDNEMVRH